ncbi:DUF4148 domain-containing protein [Polaromonas sp. JS666]|uniref:DUF4148 domain-containing protein n=1 Tax=Polaromonas sp. (strain JS666 / ATCC BAA-500) TaxID=296591 RepID=UPI00004644FB|nr:DUF4148 domain-containing protein [Polaromonas sp. JS666]ABE46181.1 hypothetical protein Bpro_4289 [Polaromonas sp. JS666]
MKSKLIASAVLAVAALTSVAASAETFNSYLWDQMKAPSTRTRAEVQAEVLQGQRGGATASSSSNGATTQQNPGASSGDTSGTAPQGAVGVVKSVQQ